MEGGSQYWSLEVKYLLRRWCWSWDTGAVEGEGGIEGDELLNVVGDRLLERDEVLEEDEHLEDDGVIKGDKLWKDDGLLNGDGLLYGDELDGRELHIHDRDGDGILTGDGVIRGDGLLDGDELDDRVVNGAAMVL